MRHAIAVFVLLAVCGAATGPVAGQVIFNASPLGPLTAPTDGPKPAFEVVSVRPNTGPTNQMSMNAPPGRFMVSGLPLQMLLVLAYRLRADQMEGVPGWVNTSRFDINAKMPDGAPQDQQPLMMQSLLEDRFRLKWHTETREADVYALVVAREDGRLGAKLTKAAIDCKPILEARQAAAQEARQRGESPQAVAERLSPAPGDPQCNTRMSFAPPVGGGAPAMTMTASGMELSTLMSLLSSLSGRPVVDRTALTGGYDFEFSFSPTGTSLATTLPGGGGGLGAPAGVGAATGLGAPAPSVVEEGPTIFQALEEQLGLKLRAEKGPVEYFVVDSIEQPEPD